MSELVDSGMSDLINELLPQSESAAAPAKPKPAGVKEEADILVRYLPAAIVQRMSKEVKDDLTHWVVNELQPAGSSPETITAQLKTDSNVKKLMAGAGAAASAAAAAPKEKYPLVAKYVEDKKILKDLSDDQKKTLEELIVSTQGDEGYKKFMLRQQLEQFAPSKAKPCAAAPAKERLDVKHKVEPQGPMAGGGAAAAAKPEVTILKARIEGDGVHAWDCTWESINNAVNVYHALKTTKSVPLDIARMPYVKGIPNISGAEIQPLSDEMINVIDTNKLLPKADYTFIEAEGGVLDPAFVALSDGAQKLKNTNGAVHAFIINTGGHWYTIVVHNNNGKLNYYIANDLPKKGGLKDYQEIIDFVKKLIA